MTEEEYYSNKSNRDSMYAERLHEAEMYDLLTKSEYRLIAMLKPSIQKDGNQWCVLYGENIQTGIAGFGNTPHSAILAFNAAFNSK